VLCTSQTLETRDHLFFDSPYARNCWEKIQINWYYSKPISERVIHARMHFPGQCFMEILFCAAWNIWKDRNDLIFNNHEASFPRWKVRFTSDLDLHRYRVKSHQVRPLLDWIDICSSQ
jgi:hypothetical protein